MTTKRILLITLVNGLTAGIFTIFVGFIVGLYESFTGNNFTEGTDNAIRNISFVIGVLIGFCIVFSPCHLFKKSQSAGHGEDSNS